VCYHVVSFLVWQEEAGFFDFRLLVGFFFSRLFLRAKARDDDVIVIVIVAPLKPCDPNTKQNFEIAPPNLHTARMASEAVRTKRARPSPSKKSEATDPPAPAPAPAPVEYEKYREDRIKANRERMKKLGLLDLSRDVRGAFTTPNATTNPKSKSKSTRRLLMPTEGSGSKTKDDLNPLSPPRRSSRYIVLH
jgi:hypothetical protein